MFNATLLMCKEPKCMCRVAFQSYLKQFKTIMFDRIVSEGNNVSFISVNTFSYRSHNDNSKNENFLADTDIVADTMCIPKIKAPFVVTGNE